MVFPEKISSSNMKIGDLIYLLLIIISCGNYFQKTTLYVHDFEPGKIKQLKTPKKKRIPKEIDNLVFHLVSSSDNKIRTSRTPRCNYLMVIIEVADHCLSLSVTRSRFCIHHMDACQWPIPKELSQDSKHLP